MTLKWATPRPLARDTGWTANSTAGDKTAVLAAYTTAIETALVAGLAPNA